MSRYIDPIVKHVVFRLDAGRLTRPIFKAGTAVAGTAVAGTAVAGTAVPCNPAINDNHSPSTIRVPLSLARIWMQSPSSRIPFLKPNSNQTKFDENGNVFDKNNKIIPSELCTPEHDISLPNHIWFRDLLECQTIEYVDIIQAKFEPIATSVVKMAAAGTAVPCNPANAGTAVPCNPANDNDNDNKIMKIFDINNQGGWKGHSPSNSPSNIPSYELFSSKPLYQYNYAEIHQALMLGPVSSMVQFIQHAAFNRIFLGTKKIKQGEAVGHHPCTPYGRLTDITKPSFYAIFPQVNARSEFPLRIFRRLAAGALSLTEMGTGDGYTIDDSVVAVESAGTNITIRKKPYTIDTPIHIGVQSAIDKIKDIVEKSLMVPRKVPKINSDYNTTINMKETKKWSALELIKLNEHGLSFLPSPKDNIPPFFITQEILDEYKKKKPGLLRELKSDLLIDPQYGLARIGQVVHKDYNILSAMNIKPFDISNPDYQVYTNDNVNMDDDDVEFKYKQDELKKIYELKFRQRTKIKIDEDENGAIIEEVQLIPCNNEYNEYLALFIVSHLSSIFGRKWVNMYLDKGVISLILSYNNAPFSLHGIVPEMLSNPSGVPTRQNVPRILELTQQLQVICRQDAVSEFSNLPFKMSTCFSNSFYQPDDGRYLKGKWRGFAPSNPSLRRYVVY